MDFGLAWRSVWRAPNAFSRLLVFGLLMLIPLLGSFVLYGLTYRVAVRTRRGEPDVLPPMSEFGKILSSGLGYFLIALLLMLPLMLFLMPASVVIDTLLNDRDTRAFGIVLLVLFYMVLIPVMLVLRGVIDFAQLRYVQTERLLSGLNFVRVFARLPRRFGDFLAICAASLLEGAIMLLGFFFFIIGGLLTVPFAAAFYGHVLGQLAKNDDTPLAQPSPAPAPPATPLDSAASSVG